jgi:hypothetical protein
MMFCQIFCNASGDDVPKYLTSSDLVRVAKTLGMTMTKQRVRLLNDAF